MNRWQKIAWYQLIVTGVALFISIIAVGILYRFVGMPRALGGCGFIGFVGFCGLSPLLFRKKKGKVDFDERDKQIQLRASFAGYLSTYLFIVAACMIPWWIIGYKGSITVNALPWLVFGQMIILIFVQSITTLIQYGRGGKGEKS